MNINLPFIDWIWRVRGRIVIDEPLSAEEVFDRLDPLFQTQGTQHRVSEGTLSFTKKNPHPQDKLATFTKGDLRFVKGERQDALVYDLSSPALLACFLAPLLFLAFAMVTNVVNDFHAAGQANERTAQETAEEDVEDDEDETEHELHWIDQMLGAPEPKDEDEEDAEEEEEEDKHSPTAAYVLAGIFAFLYAFGRILEPWIIKNRFKKSIEDE